MTSFRTLILCAAFQDSGRDWQGGHLWKLKDYLLQRLLILVRDGSGHIQACQMRLPFATKKGLRYLWLSSSNMPHGTGSGSPLHFKFHLADFPRDARIVIVEGVLKADVLSAIRPELYIIATPCVTANHGPIIELTHGRPVLDNVRSIALLRMDDATFLIVAWAPLVLLH
jgi:hypothetical protein